MTDHQTTDTPATPSGLETVSGEIVGRDPRLMTAPELAALGHSSSSLLEAVRAKCIDCCGGEKTEARKCVAVGCTLWPFRMGTNPLAKRSLSDTQKAAARDRMALVRQAREAKAA